MNIEQARFNMIEQQIRPWDVLDQDVLNLLSIVKRENFVPAAYRNIAFADLEIPLPAGQHMLFPRVEARVLQELAVKKHEVVLEIVDHDAVEVDFDQGQASLKVKGLDVFDDHDPHRPARHPLQQRATDFAS